MGNRADFVYQLFVGTFDVEMLVGNGIYQLFDPLSEFAVIFHPTGYDFTGMDDGGVVPATKKGADGL